MDREVATVWLPGGRNIKIATAPGVFLAFNGGTARILDTPQKEAQLVAAMRMPEAKITILGDWSKWVQKWIRLCGDKPCVAQIMAFDGESYVHVQDDKDREIGWLSTHRRKIGKHKVGCQCGMCLRVINTIVQKAVRERTGVPLDLMNPSEEFEPIDVHAEVA